MRVAFDLDGTLDASPELCKLLRALKKRGDKIVVLTGCHEEPITDADIDEKRAKLDSLGVGDSVDKLKVYPQSRVAQCKAEYCRRKDVALFIDNSLRNASLAPDGTTVLVPWKHLTG
jgi:hypothetical protein